MSDHKLILVPATPETTPPAAQVIERALREVGLIGETTNYFGDTHYRPGPRFYDLILFEQSHPVVSLRHGPKGLERDGVSDSRTLCTVELPAPTSTVQWFGAGHVTDPSCRKCGHCLHDWGDMLGEYFNDQTSYVWSCPTCRHQSRPWELDWRDTCGFGRCSVDIWRVHHGEARPHAELLEVLRATTQVPWHYFYFHR
jgi:hypothetical protein